MEPYAVLKVGRRSVAASVGLARHQHRRPTRASTGLVSEGVQNQVNGAVGGGNTQDHDRNRCKCKHGNHYQTTQVRPAFWLNP